MSRVVVALSGGVDSAVAAALLQEAGHDLIGVTMRLWPKSRCCDEKDIEDAAELCTLLGIPYQVLDYRERFRREIVDPFIAAYQEGRTPNPCTRCNQVLKFSALWQEAQVLGADSLATGHYVRRSGSAPAQLWRGVDERKDQSYFLYAIERELLPRLLFPLGALRKEEVRAIAKARGLPVAGKQESQDVCFIAGDYRSFLREQGVSGRPGNIVNLYGETVGTHDGVINFTVGQRRGIGGGSAMPLYVLAVDAKRDQVRVGPAEYLYQDQLRIHDCNWLGELSPGREERVTVKLRYAAPPVSATLRLGQGGEASLHLDTAQRAITPGQAAVCYQKECLLGGGIISEFGIPAGSAAE
ncbi:tRNA 2-thiouridine(34) synthase MnmA [Acidithiobacillus sp. AMEEHan]|uniref:tRNA 2-thiouridine(34) synthase MnmA n=1 Tax=Acidithiobacillus sp. AMEEHan TaxID=2994951 RepID=UPI0027E43662|nr:tRNA 2-thiouridine(34) synthase MnmA [Acidithiobacillus sp. AMEEHan]